MGERSLDGGRGLLGGLSDAGERSRTGGEVSRTGAEVFQTGERSLACGVSCMWRRGLSHVGERSSSRMWGSGLALACGGEVSRMWGRGLSHVGERSLGREERYRSLGRGERSFWTGCAWSLYPFISGEAPSVLHH